MLALFSQRLGCKTCIREGKHELSPTCRPFGMLAHSRQIGFQSVVGDVTDVYPLPAGVRLHVGHRGSGIHHLGGCSRMRWRSYGPCIYRFFLFKFANEKRITNSFFVFKFANEKRIPF